MRIAIIGAGISAIAFAGVLKRFGYACTLFEKADRVGGIWALAYPDVCLQNSYEQYEFIDFPWPEPPDQHPTATQILHYLDAAVAHYELDLRLGHEVVALTQRDDGWQLTAAHANGELNEAFDYVVVSIGQYAEQKLRPAFPGEDVFRGDIITERELRSLDQFDGRRVAVVGFGKSAVDMAAFAAPRAQSVTHVFREPRWLIPRRVLGMHFTYPFFPRASTALMPAWSHPAAAERVLHHHGAPLVNAFWRVVEWYVRRHIRRHAADDAGRRRLDAVTPRHPFVDDFRSATAMAPPPYFGLVANGRIEPVHDTFEGFSAHGLRLGSGAEAAADLAVLSLGSGTPRFPFLPPAYRELLEAHDDGVQLYRHIVHPRVPRLAFAGYNHGFMHVPAAQVGALWLVAVLRGDLALPPAAAQEASIARIRDWKRAHVQYEPSRSCAVSTRFQQHIDGLLCELGLSPWRKLPNPLAECFGRYGGADYRGVLEEYAAGRGRPRTLPLDI